jgi:hypothetical protein
MAAAGASLTTCFPDVGGKWPKMRGECTAQGTIEPVAGPGRVVEVMDAQSVTARPGAQIVPERVAPMLERAMSAVTDGAAAPWRQVFPDYATGMRIGIKVNCLNQFLATSVPVVQALIAGLRRDLGIPGTDIVVWDRRLDELTRGGFSRDVLGVPVVGTVNAIDDGSGPGYEEACCQVSAGKMVRFSRVLTELTDVTINCPVLKAHEVSGVTAALKNVYGVIDNPGDFHDDLNTALPAIYSLSPIRERFRFTVLDALIAVILRGTASLSDLTPKRVVVSRDPLALDIYAVGLVNQLRADSGGSVAPVPEQSIEWLGNAYRAGIGASVVDLVSITV